MTKIIVVFAEALAAPEVVWSLHDDGFDVTAAFRRGRRTALRRSRAVSILEVTPPEQNLAVCIEELGTATRESGALLMPVDDAGVLVCGEIAQRDPVVVVVGPRGVHAELALDKQRQLDSATAAGLLVPPTTVVHTVSELTHDARDFPVVLKAADVFRAVDGRLERGRSFVCANPAELESAAMAWDERYALLVQPLLSGVGEGLFGLRGASGEFAWSAHRRIRMMNPQGSGSSACESVPVDPELVVGATRFLDTADWSGLFMLEFLRDRNGRAWFMELNGRAWGSMALALRLGLDYPAWAARSAVDREFKPSMPADRPHLVCRHLGREIVHLLFAFRGPRSTSSADWPRPLPTLRRLLAVRRDERWYNWRRDDWRVFVADTVETVTSQVRGRAA